VLEDASLGMYEDWFWTGLTFWKEGRYCTKEDNFLLDHLVTASQWGTPCIVVNYKDGSWRAFACYTTDVPEEERDIMNEQIKAQTESAFWTSGCMSGPLQNHLPELEPYPEGVPAQETTT
jgi:hypothetical protein